MAVLEVFAYLGVRDAQAAIDFYTQAFGAREKLRLTEPSGRVGHAELALGGTTLMLAEEHPEFGLVGPTTLGGTPVMIHLHVDDADATLAAAFALGAEVERPCEDMFYGERSGTFVDPFGHRWNVGHSIEEVSAEEMQRRYVEAMGG